ncbi:MAG: bifunctional UDP-N-acetylglucosamine diphosphorylase/glucosamine-1-phosphate N-acetyltransferase GlmU [Candidatus Dependentiae bacterium]
MKQLFKKAHLVFLCILAMANKTSYPTTDDQREGDCMLSTKVQGVVLAAGQGTRFKTGRSKLVEKICGQEMILFATRLLEQLHIPTLVVVGYQKELIKEVLDNYHGSSIEYCVQEQQKGTGHAVLCTQQHWDRDHLLIMNGDVPLVTPDIIEHLYNEHTRTNAEISFVTAHNPDPSCGGYGRVIKKDNSIAIVEARDFEGDPTEECCINAGIYLIRRSFLEDTIGTLKLNEKSQEFYLTDLVKIASDKNLVVTTINAPFDRIRGINNFQELWAAEQVKRCELLKYWMDHGVHFSAAQSVHLDLNITIGSGTYVGCGVHLQGKTIIGKNCKINEFVSLENVTMGDDVVIHPQSIVKNSTIESLAEVGPFGYIDNSIVKEKAQVGKFVELKRTTMGRVSKAKHLAYLGDAEIGDRVNIGAGTIICNYDGTHKHKTKIGDDAFIGSNNTLIAPVTIGNKAFTAAGSVITDDVPDSALAIGRTQQTNKEGYAEKLRKSQQEPQVEFTAAGFLGTLKSKNNSCQ